MSYKFVYLLWLHSSRWSCRHSVYKRNWSNTTWTNPYSTLECRYKENLLLFCVRQQHNNCRALSNSCSTSLFTHWSLCMSNSVQSEQLTDTSNNFKTCRLSLLQRQTNTPIDTDIAVIVCQRLRTSQRTQCSSTDTLTAAITYCLLLLNVLTIFNIRDGLR